MAENRDRVNANRRRYREKKRKMLEDIKLESGCIRCGYNRVSAALAFHHRWGKLFVVSQKRCDLGMDRLLAEIEKCDVLCLNCHAELYPMGHRAPARARK